MKKPLIESEFNRLQEKLNSLPATGAPLSIEQVADLLNRAIEEDAQ